jgi:hypothetical protein
VTDIGLEAVLGFQRIDQRPDGSRIKLGDAAATAADQVDVLGIGG